MNDKFMQLMEKQNKRFKHDIYLFIFMLSWGVPLCVWCIAQVINGL